MIQAASFGNPRAFIRFRCADSARGLIGQNCADFCPVYIIGQDYDHFCLLPDGGGQGIRQNYSDFCLTGECPTIFALMPDASTTLFLTNKQKIP